MTKFEDLAKLTGAQIQKDEFPSPEHRVTLNLSGRKVRAWLLVSIDRENSAKRNTLLITHPQEIEILLAPSLRERWNQYRRDLSSCTDEWHFHALPVLKRVVRLYREGQRFSNFDLTTVVHHHGAVPALVVGRIDDHQVALYPEDFGRTKSKAKSTDEETVELLRSLSDFLPIMFTAYFEQISYYMRSALFTTTEEHVMEFCQRIRQIAKRSVVQKLDMIERIASRKPNSSVSYHLALELLHRYENQIHEARAVDAFSHLLVNYIYRFYCIADRVEEYSKRLRAIPSHPSAFECDPIHTMQECVDNIENPADRFLRHLEEQADQMQGWLLTMSKMSTSIAEVVKATNGTPLDRPKLFVTYPFDIDESEEFIKRLKHEAQSRNSGVEIIAGRRHVDRDIRSALLARVWMCDHHVLFLPGSWKKNNGEYKSLRRERNWVVLELIYSSILGRDLTPITSDSPNDQALDDFVKLVKNYTTEKEIPETPEQGWERVVTKWKSRIADILYSRRRLRCDPYDSTWDEFWVQFDRHVLAVTRKHLLDVLFDAWRHFFDEDTWSVIEALMELRFSRFLSVCSVREVANFLREKAAENSRFEWVKHYENNVALESALRKNHLGDVDVFGTLRQFAFVLDGRPFHPLVATMHSGRLEIELHVDQMYRLLCANLQIDEDEEYFQRICHRLMT